jgi:FAD-dependent urate hydroxylase
MGQTSIDALVIGAGPYGLSLSAHFKRAGIEHKVLGQTMGAWHHFPRGMCLRSPARASSLSDPDGALTLERFGEEVGTTLGHPVPLETFLDYGHWFAERSGLDIDDRMVTTLSARDDEFTATLEDGEVVRARKVVLAVGSDQFQWIPPEYRDLPAELVSHTGDHRDFSAFAGKEVAVMGIGQMGVESAALLHECGARVRVIARAPQVRWLSRSARLHDSAFSSLLYAPSDVGPAGMSRVVAVPTLFRQFPATLRVKMVRRCARPAAAAWLIDRTRDVDMEMGCQIRSVRAASGRVQIATQGDRVFEADHLVLATGFKVDLSKYDFIDPGLFASIRRVGGFPVLRRGMTTSVPGLHMVGWPATWSYGPLMRHVVGAEFASHAVTERILQTRARGYRAATAEVQPAAV